MVHLRDGFDAIELKAIYNKLLKERGCPFDPHKSP